MASLPTVVKSGDQRRSLESLRDLLADTLVSAEPANVAALAKQLQAVLKELAELPAAKETTPVDDLARARAERRAAASPAVPAAGADVGRRRGR